MTANCRAYKDYELVGDKEYHKKNIQILIRFKTYRVFFNSNMSGVGGRFGDCQKGAE